MNLLNFFVLLLSIPFQYQPNQTLMNPIRLQASLLSGLWMPMLLVGTLLFSQSGNAQTQVLVPEDIVANDFANNAVGGWRILSKGNSNCSLVAVADYGITQNSGPHSLRATRTGGGGVNRSFVGYYEEGRTLNSLSSVSWNQFTEQGSDSYLNIFLTDGFSVATVIYQPATVLNAWTTHTFNSNSSTSVLSIRVGSTMTPITYTDLMNQYGSWLIYNHPLTFVFPNSATDFIGGIVLVSGSSNPTLPQTHTFDKASISYTGEAPLVFDFATSTPPPPACTAVSVVSYEPGNRQDGTPVLPTRQFFNNATSAPQNSDVAVPEDALNFVSLGFGGQIVLELEVPIANGEGDDFMVYETTYLPSTIEKCKRSPETIKAYASQDGCNFVYLGEGCQDVSFDLRSLAWARFIKLVDVSPIGVVFTNGNNGPEDGFDLDGIECLNGMATDLTPSSLIPAVLTQVIDHTPDSQARRKNNTLIINGTPERRVVTRMLGIPENNNTVNFYSMGFGGFVVVKFDFVVFNGIGSDLKVYETSYGNPTCANYPERANVEVSLDGATWLDLGTYCQDGLLDIAATGFQGIQYVRLVDRSPVSSTKFPGNADAYDLDGIVDLHACASTSTSRLADNSGEEVIEGLPNSASIYPNPFEDKVTVSFINESNDKEVSISVYNLVGALVYSKNYAVESEAFFNQVIDLSELPAGLYTIHTACPSFMQTDKILKR